MSELTRRRFLVGTSAGVGVAVAGALTALPAVLPAAGAHLGVSNQPLDPNAGPMVLHVRDVASGEVALMAGTTEVVYRDQELVRRLVSRAAPSGLGMVR